MRLVDYHGERLRSFCGEPSLQPDSSRRNPMTTTSDTRTVTSTDGTHIEFDRIGTGPAVVIIGAGPTDRTINSPIADLLATQYTVFNYDRRARGGSGDTQPYSVDREFEDLAAVINAAGDNAAVYGTSGGAIWALEAAVRSLSISRLVLWEPPYIADDETTRTRPTGYPERLADAVSQNRPADAVELFFTQAVGMPVEFVDQMRQAPFWAAMTASATGLVYDSKLIGDFTLPADRLGEIAVATLVVDGGTTPWLTHSADAVAKAVPTAQRRTLAGQPHNVDAAAIAPVLAEFFAD
jgi:hypothetical protein